MMRTIYESIKSIYWMASGAIQTNKTLFVERDKSILERKIYRALWNYYKGKSRRFCFSEPTENFRMDGTGAESWVRDSIKAGKLHDEDYCVFKLLLNEDGAVLDIGANWGYSVPSIWAMAPDVRIISFEPLAGYRASLQQIKNGFDEKYDFRMLGLGASDYIAKFASPVINSVAISALTSAAEDRNRGEIECVSRMAAEFALQSVTDGVPIEFSIYEFVAQIKKLDNILREDVTILSGKKLLALKIDAEGLEGDILRGAESSLMQHRPIVMLEGGNRYAGLTEYMAMLGYGYYEREGSTMHPISGVGTAVNGFFFHSQHRLLLANKGFSFK